MWDCKYKVGEDRCRLRRTKCYPGGKKCVLYGKFEYPFREEIDGLDGPKELPKKKPKKGKRSR